jgi:hypothetical protein
VFLCKKSWERKREVDLWVTDLERGKEHRARTLMSCGEQLF